MKRIFTLITLLLMLTHLGAYAGYDWLSYRYGQYSGQCVVYADLVDGSSQAVMNGNNIQHYALGAFIDGVCRGMAKAKAETPAASTGGEVCYFPLRIEGTAADNGKAVSFRLMELDDYENPILEYVVTGNAPYTYQNEATPAQGVPSSLYHLTFIKPTQFEISPSTIHVNVGQTIDLNDYLKLTPTNATKLVDAAFECDNTKYFTITDGHLLKGTKTTQGMNPVVVRYMYMSKSELADAVVYVDQTVTGLELITDYTNGVVADLEDGLTLTQYVKTAFNLLPAGVTAPIQLTPNDASALVYMSGSDRWVPKKVGNYTLTATVGAFSATLKVKVQQRAQSLKRHLSDIYVYKDRDITDLLKANVYPEPVGSVYNNLAFYPTENDGVLRRENNGHITTIGVGEAFIRATASNDSVHCTFKVHVQPNVTSLNIKANPLNIDWDPNGDGYQDIDDQVSDNFTFAPTAPAANKYQLTSSATDVVTVEAAMAYAGYMIKARKAGSSVLTVTYKDKETRLDAGTSTLATTERTLTKTFTVNIVQGLTGFTIGNVVMGNRTTHALRLTPVPADAQFDPSKVSLVITNDDSNFPTTWKFAEAAADATGLQWTITPRSVGKGTIAARYDGNTIGRATITIGQEINDVAGWQWRTYFAAPVDNAGIHTLYGDDVLEIRSAEDLLYNDAQYGYFGTLKSLEMNKCYKVRLKDGAAPVNAMAPATTIDYQPRPGKRIDVNLAWNWIAYPYQYDRPLSSFMLDGGIMTGSRIVSKDGGFAEYSGSAWTGDLTTLKAGEGYMFYNSQPTASMHQLSFPAESMLPQPAPTSPAKRNGLVETSVWAYNSAAFADNMTIIAEVPELTRASDCTVGAFVGDECRGEGRLVEGRYFITVHGKGGEAVSFKLYDKVTGEYRLLSGGLPFDKMAGSLAKPVVMKLGGTTSVGQITAESSDITVADGRLHFNGLQVKSFRVNAVNGSTQLVNDTDLTQLPSGVYIVTVVTTDGRTLSRKVAR